MHLHRLLKHGLGLNVLLHSLQSRLHLHLLDGLMQLVLHLQRLSGMQSLRRLCLYGRHELLHGHGLLHMHGLLRRHGLQGLLHLCGMQLRSLHRLLHELRWLPSTLRRHLLQPLLRGWLRGLHGHRLAPCLYVVRLSLSSCCWESQPFSEWYVVLCCLPRSSRELSMVVCTHALTAALLND